MIEDNLREKKFSNSYRNRNFKNSVDKFEKVLKLLPLKFLNYIYDMKNEMFHMLLFL